MTLLLAAVVLLAWPYIGLAPEIRIGGSTIDAPVADLAAAALFPLAAWGGWRRPVPLPGPVGYALVLLAGVLALANALDPAASAWFLVRKPLFLWLAYGVGLAWVVARGLPAGALRGLLLATVTLAAAISLVTSVGRIASGNALWFSAIGGLTNNHKTLAVALAPAVPLVLGLRRGRLDDAVLALLLGALALSMSRTAWIAAAAGASFFVVWRGRTLASRRGLVLAIVVAGALAAIYGPLLARSNVQLDAARSRHSLDKRAGEMFAAHPLVGYGGGTNVVYEQQTFPDYRVNGVDAHGVVQKVGSEFGLLGLVGYAAFVGSMALRVRARASGGGRVGTGAWAAFVGAHANLLFSTETFSHTHWVPIAVIWGLSHREDAP